MPQMPAPVRTCAGIVLGAAICGALPSVAAAAAGSPVATRVSDRNVPIELGTQREIVVEGLEHPWSMAWLPDGSLLVTERPGRLRIVRDGRLDPQPIAGVPAVFAQNQGGLLDVALHPQFASNRFVYLTYSHGTQAANRTRLARGRLEGNRLQNVQVLFEVAHTKSGGAHFGSRIAWLPDSTLLLSIGDGGNPPTSLDGRFMREYAQDLSRHFGKILRLRDDGTVPPDNPFAKTAGAQPAIWAYGHRNIQGLTYDRTRNQVWSTEHGSLGGDELNRPRAGGNSGWPLVSRTREYTTGAPVSAAQSRPGMDDPVVLWEVSVAPSGLLVYDGSAFPQWRGDLFAGSLMSLDVRRIDLDEQGRVLGETAVRVGQRVRDVRQGPDGFLYVLTDERAARLLRFRPAAVGPTAPVALPSTTAAPAGSTAKPVPAPP